jgi:hypothetical protein
MSHQSKITITLFVAAACLVITSLWKFERLPFACTVEESEHEIEGGVTLTSINKDCSYNKHRTIAFAYRKPENFLSTIMFITAQSKDESPTGFGYLEDLDGDEMPEAFVLGNCDAKGGCETSVHAINMVMEMEHLFTVHSSDLVMKGNILIASNRDSCCEWRYDYYQGPLKNISETLDNSYISSIWSTNGDETPLDVFETY